MESIEVLHWKKPGASMPKEFHEAGIRILHHENEILRIHMLNVPKCLKTYQEDKNTKREPYGFAALSLGAITSIGIQLWGDFNIPDGEGGTQDAAYTSFFIPFTNILCIEHVDIGLATTRTRR